MTLHATKFILFCSLILGFVSHAHASTVGRIQASDQNTESASIPPPPPGIIQDISTEKASTVYQWKDADGKTYFSDESPAENIQAEAIELDVSPENSTDDKYSIVNQAKRMEDSRKELEKDRDAKRQKELAEKQARAAAQPNNYPQDYSDGYDYGYGYGGYPGYNVRHRTGPSIYRPDQPLSTTEKFNRRNELPLYQKPRPMPPGHGPKPVPLPQPAPAGGSVRLGR